MLRSVSEHAFVLDSFEFIFTGVLLLVLAWTFYRSRDLRERAEWVWLLGALCLLAATFFTNSVLHFYHLYYNEELPLPLDPRAVLFVFLLGAALCFGGIFTSRLSSRSPVFVLAVVGGGGGLVDLLLHLLSWGWNHAPLHWLVMAIFFGVWSALGPERSFSPASRRLLRLACLGLSASLVLQFLCSLSPDALCPVAALFRHLMLAAALVALARLIEVETADLGVQFVIRLNGIFIVLAGGIILVTVGALRQEHFNSLSRDTFSLTEFLQNRLIDFHRQDGDGPDFLNAPLMDSRVSGEFSGRSTLLSVTVRINETQVVLLRQPSGEVERRTERAPPLKPPGAGLQLIDEHQVRVSLPIHLADGSRPAGWVEVTESMVATHREGARLILVIFTVFLLMALVSGVSIAMTVARAGNTIREQYQELEQTHLQLLQAAKGAALGEMAGGVAHELNNPLGVVLGRASYLKVMANKAGRKDILGDLEVIERNAARASRIIGDLLDFARPHPLSRGRHDINQIVSETIQLTRPRLSDRQIKLHEKFSPIVEAVVDRDRLQQVLVNLLNNAIDACAEGGNIIIKTEYDARSELVAISIKDDGVGISRESLEHIFDPFYTTKGKGTGLGLSVSYRIIRDHGGEILVDSQEGVGSCFRVTLTTAQTRERP